MFWSLWAVWESYMPKPDLVLRKLEGHQCTWRLVSIPYVKSDILYLTHEWSSHVAPLLSLSCLYLLFTMLRQPQWRSQTLFAEPFLGSARSAMHPTKHVWHMAGLLDWQRPHRAVQALCHTPGLCWQAICRLTPTSIPQMISHRYGNALLHTPFLLERKTVELCPTHSMKSILSWSCFQPWEKRSPENNTPKTTRDATDPSHNLSFGVGTLTWMVPTHQDNLRSGLKIRAPTEERNSLSTAAAQRHMQKLHVS